jgi:tol-pal system protein YbgF
MKNLCMHRAAATLLLVVSAMSSPVLLADAATDARLDSIERKLDSRGLLEMLNRVEQMQQTIQQLRGDLEVQSHTLEEMQRRSREQYLDLDRRLQQLETGQSGTASLDSTPVLTAPPGMSPEMPPDAQAPVAPPEVQQPRQPPPAPATPPATQAGELAEYEQALAILREGRYAEATQAFKGFLASYPGSSYADNAGYWLGETYYVTRDFDQALAAFKGLTDNYPNSPKAPDSYLKTGYIYYEKQDWAAARQALDTVISGYPGTTAARLAADRLQSMKRDGR